MGIYELLPTSKIQGFYELKNHKLRLTAEIPVENIIWGIQFVRVPWMGAIKFKLVAWVGPPTTPSTRTFEQTFHLPSLLRVLVCDQANPKGTVLDVHVVGGVIPVDQPAAPKKLLTATPDSATAAGTDVDELYADLPATLNVAYDTTFQISRPTDVPKLGEIVPVYDASFLILEDARIVDKSIVWTFRATQTGNTQVIIEIFGGIAKYVMKITYNINVILPQEPDPVISAASANNEVGTDIKTATGTEDARVFHSFLSRVNTARRIVQKHWPNAALYNATAQTWLKTGVDTVDQLTHMTMSFRTGQGYVTIESTGYYDFKKPVYVNHPILGPANVDWPVSLSPEEACELLRNQGITGKIVSVELMKPLYPKSQNYYVFNMLGQPAVWVGLKRKDVIVGGPKVEGGSGE